MVDVDTVVIPDLCKKYNITEQTFSGGGPSTTVQGYQRHASAKTWNSKMQNASYERKQPAKDEVAAGRRVRNGLHRPKTDHSSGLRYIWRVTAVLDLT